jgi:uncharacterized protein (DUF342 family)
VIEGSCSGAGLSFHLEGEDGNALTAVFEPAVNMSPIDAAWVNQMVAAQGLADFFIFADAVDELVTKYNAASDSFTLTIGERRDGTFSIDIAPDLMSAFLTIIPPFGGQAVTSEQIYECLRETGIIYGIMDENIAESLAKGHVHNKLIAAGVHPIPGEDTQFLSLVAEAKERRPQLDEHDNVDYRNLGNILSVKPGDPLMRRLPPTEGKPGKNIHGFLISAPKGNDIPFQLELSGTAFDQNDHDLLVAAVCGQPILVPNGVIVEPIITLKNVDLSSGNLQVAGTLNITGDVKSGMNVKATGDIIIGGVVEAAQIEAGGDLEIKGGIIGQGDTGNNGDELNSATAVIQAKGSVKALYVENASVSAGVDIFVRELVMKSVLSAGDRIMVGEPGSGKGRIIGGVCRATTRIETGVAGSRASVITRLEVGVDPSIRERFASVTHLLAVKQKELEETGKSLAYIRGNTHRLDLNITKEKEKIFLCLQTEIQELLGQKRRLEKRMKLVENAGIRVERELYSGVRIRIGEHSLLIEEDMENVAFRMGEDGIVY